MLIGVVERLDGIFQIVKLTELMRHLWKNKRDSTADGLLSIGDDALDRYCKLVEQLLDFFEDGCY